MNISNMNIMNNLIDFKVYTAANCEYDNKRVGQDALGRFHFVVRVSLAHIYID